MCVLVAADRQLMRGCLAALLEIERGFRILVQAGCDGSAMGIALEQQQDVVVVDLHDDAALAFVENMYSLVPECPIVALSSTACGQTIRRTLDAGVTGLVDYRASAEAFAEAVRRAAAGRRVIDPDLALAALRAVRNPLTEREHGVLLLMADGASNGEIAAKLSLSAGTVRNYIGRVVKQLAARSRVDAVRIARASGWV